MEKISIPPCYKYIARNLKSDSDKHLYAKNYLANILEHGLDRDEAIMLYTANTLPLTVGNMYSVNGVDVRAEDYFDYVNGESSLIVQQCSKFYKERLKVGQKNNLCLICSYSNNFANDHYDDECAVFKYIISDKSRRDEVIALELPEIFRSIVDIGSELSEPYPALIPIMALAYNQLKELDDIYTVPSIAERLEKLIIKLSVAASSYSGDVKKLLSKNARAMSVAWGKVSNDIVSAPDLSYDDVCRILSKIDLEHNHRQRNSKKSKKKAVEVSKESQSQPSDNIAVEESTDVASEPQTEVVPESSADISSEQPAPPTENDTALDDSEELPFGDADIVMESGDTTDGTVSDSAEEVDPDVAEYESVKRDKDGWVIQDESSAEDTENEDIAPTEDKADEDTDNTEQPSVSDGPKPAMQPSQTNSSEQSESPKYSVPPINDTSCIFIADVPRRTIKKYCSSYKDNENEVFSSVRRSKRLPVEVILDEKRTPFLIFFVRSLGKFYYCPIEKAMPATLKACMQSTSIKKLCYQPYYLYSLMRLYDCSLDSVYSICTVDLLLNPKAMVCVYEDYFKVYDGNFPIKSKPSSGYDEFDAILENEQRYIQIEAFQMRSLKNDKELSKRQQRDEVLGMSYLRILNLKTHDYLFDLEPSGKVEFNPNFDLAARHDGFFVTYSLGIDNSLGIKVNDIYLGALYELSRKGKVRKYNIQLVTITANTMVLFVGENEYDLVTTALQKYFNIYALKNRYEKFELNVSHQRIYCSTQKNAKQPVLPATYSEAMDMLVTTNASVVVDDSHVVKRKKNTQNKRKKQNQKYNPN